MKKFVIFLIPVIIMLLLMYYVYSHDMMEIPEPPTFPPETQLLNERLKQGDGEFSYLTREFTKDKGLSVDEDSIIDVGVYTDEKPTADGKGNEDINRIHAEKKAERFLSFLKDEKAAGSEYKDGRYTVYLASGGSFVSDGNTIVLSVEENKFSPDDSKGRCARLFMQDKYLSAMCSMADIHNIQLDMKKKTDEKGFTRVSLTAYTDDRTLSGRIENSAFCSVRAEFSDEKEGVTYTLTLFNVQKAPVTGMKSYADAVIEENIKTDISLAGCEVVYSAGVKKGYYVPCYKFSHISRHGDGDLLEVDETLVPMYETD